MTPMIPWLLVSLSLILLCAANTAAAELPNLTGSKLSLRDAIAITLVNNPQIQLQDYVVEQVQGQEQQADGQFDLEVVGNITYGRVFTPAYQENILIGGQSLETSRSDTFSYQIGLQKQLKNGITLNPNVQMQRETSGPPVQGLGNINFKVIVPLMRGFGVDAVTAQLRSSKLTVEQQELLLYAALSTQVKDTVNFYWQAVSAYKQLEYYRQAEKVYEETYHITQQLLKHRSSTAPEMLEIRAQLETAIADRIQGEQQLYASRQQLAISLGFDPMQLELVPDPHTDFPDLVTVQDITQLSIPELLGKASANRPELSAALKAVDAQQALMAQVENSLLPKLDLTLTTGYAGVHRGSQFINDFTPLGYHLRGINALGTVEMEWPVQNNFAEGQWVQQKAAVRQAEVQTYITRQTISAQVLLAFENLINSIREIKFRTKSRIDNETFVADQRRLYRDGFVSLFELVEIEQTLTFAQIQEVNAIMTYAQSLNNLQYAIGGIVPTDSDAPQIEIDKFMMLPNMESM